jgi:ferric enterobactin receptor
LFVYPFSQNAMRQYLLLGLLFIGSYQAFSQNKFNITGVIAEQTDKKGIPYMTVSLIDTLTKLPKSNTFTGETGKFKFENIQTGTYYVLATSVGFLPSKSALIVVVDKSLTTDTLFMEKTAKDFKEVVVAASKPLLEVESDKVIYNVENDATLQGLNAIEALKKMPFVTVDADDNIQMKGSSNFKVLLNGKSTSIVAKNPSEALKSFPASLIKRIEVITEPSAKYDADGTAGIINIITKKKVFGYNGSVNISYNSRGMNNGGGNFNAKKGKFGMSAYFGGNAYNYVNQMTTDYSRTSKTPGFESTLNQFSTNSTKGTWYYGSSELAYDFDSLHTLSFYASPNGGNNKNISLQNSEVFNNLNILTDSFSSNTSNKSENPSLDFGFDFIKKFKDNSEHEITFSAARERRRDNSSYTSLQNFTSKLDQDIFNTNDSKNIENTLKIDYTKPFKNKTSLESGVKLITRDLVSDYKMLQRNLPTETYTEMPLNTNTLQYDQNVGSLYTTYAFSVKTYKIKLGARVEQTWINASFNRDSMPFKTDYTNFIPTASVSYKYKKAHTLRLNYSKRIQRPWMFYLNPYVNNQNPKSISFGNPNLTPEKTHSVSFSWNYFYKQNSLDLSLSNSFTDDVITSFTTIDTSGIMYTSYYNIAKSNTTGLSLSFWGMLFGKMQLWANLSTSYVKITHTLDASRNRSGFSNRAHMNATWNFKYGISTTLGGYAWQGAPTLQTVRPLNYSYNLSVRKSFLKKKLNVGLVANNFLNGTQTLKTISEDPNFSSVSTFNNTFFRFYSISVSYNFGKLKENVSRKKGISNDDKKSGE